MNRKILLASLVFVVCLVGGIPSVWGQSPIKLSFGLGYDNVSEMYYLAHYDTLGVTPESLEVLRRSTEKIEEKKAIFRFELKKNIFGNSRLSINNKFSLSSLYLRDILRIEWEKDWFSLANESELKTIQDEEKVQYQTDHFINDLDVKIKASLSSATKLILRNSLEYVEYKEDSAFTYTYNYYLNRTSLELDQDILDNGFLRLSYQFSKRHVPDSSLIDYNRHLLDISFDKYFGWKTMLLLENELDRTTFNKPGKQDDFWEDRFSFGLNRKIGERTEIKLRNVFEVLGYDQEDEINFGYYEYKLYAALEYEPLEGLELGTGPELIGFSSLKSTYQDYNYRQWGLVASFDLMRSARFWLGAEEKFGQRDYLSNENPFYTDHLLNQLSFFLNADLNSHFGFNLMLSVDSEWHDYQGDDLTVYLISSELTYSF
jgi:hypothetical protein